MEQRYSSPASYMAESAVSGAEQVSGADAKHPPSYFEAQTPHGDLAMRYTELLLAGKRREAGDLIVAALDEPGSTLTVKDIYLHVFQPALYEIGRLWQLNVISVAEEHLFTAATQLVMSRLYPRIFTSERKPYSMVAACVDDELHEVGVRMVTDFFEMNGWDTTYLGANMPQDAIVHAVQERRPDILAISLTMSYRLHAVSEILKRVRDDESCRGVKVLVGGYCFRAFPDLWKRVGADGYAADAAAAIAKAEQLVRSKSSVAK
ncbi:MAG: cobalamin B12-binding domain-containing protein [Oceanidesulfovibrio sp.]